MNCEIRRAKLEDTETIVKILDRVTQYLNSKGIYQWEYPWNAEVILKDIESKNVFIVYYEGNSVGTFGLRKLEEEKFEVMQIGDYYIYRIALIPELQGKNLGRDIIDFACNYTAIEGFPLYLDCYYGNKNLRKFYSSAGMDYVGDYPEEDYFVSVYKH